MMFKSRRCTQIAKQLFNLVANKYGGPEVSICIINSNHQVIIMGSMDNYVNTQKNMAQRLAQTALYVGGYTGEKKFTPNKEMGQYYPPNYFTNDLGGVAIRSETGELLGAIGVHGRRDTDSPNNQELAYWCSRFFPGTYTVRTLEDFNFLRAKDILKQSGQALELKHEELSAYQLLLDYIRKVFKFRTLRID